MPNHIEHPPLTLPVLFPQLTPSSRSSPAFYFNRIDFKLSHCSSLDSSCKSWIEFSCLFNSVWCNFSLTGFGYIYIFISVIFICYKYHMISFEATEILKIEKMCLFFMILPLEFTRKYLSSKFNIRCFCLDSSKIVVFVHLQTFFCHRLL